MDKLFYPAYPVDPANFRLFSNCTPLAQKDGCKIRAEKNRRIDRMREVRGVAIYDCEA